MLKTKTVAYGIADFIKWPDIDKLGQHECMSVLISKHIWPPTYINHLDTYLSFQPHYQGPTNDI